VSDLTDLAARVRVASVTGTMTPELARDLLAELHKRQSHEARLAERNRALRAAGALLGAGLKSTERAKQLHALLSAAQRSTRQAPPDLNTLDGCISAALHACPKVPGARQLWNVLEGLEDM